MRGKCLDVGCLPYITHPPSVVADNLSSLEKHATVRLWPDVFDKDWLVVAGADAHWPAGMA